MGIENTPNEARGATQPVKDVLFHIDHRLDDLHRLCVRQGLSEEVEVALRADLEEEKALLAAQAPDISLLEALSLQNAHYERADARMEVLKGETQDLSSLRSIEVPPEE